MKLIRLLLLLTLAACAGPALGTVAVQSGSTVDVTWIDNATDEDGYVIRRSVDGGTYADVATLPSDATAWTDAGPLIEGATYCYRVVATKLGVESSSGEDCVTITVQPPAAPTGVTATEVQPVTYHVDPGGDDVTGDGSEGNPWATPQHAIATAPLDATIVLGDGSYSGRITIDRRVALTGGRGAELEGVTITADGAVLVGVDAEAVDCAAGPSVDVDADSVTVQDVRAHDSCVAGLQTSATSANGLIADNVLDRNSGAGAEIQGTGHTVVRNDAFGSLQHHPKWGGAAPSWADADAYRFFGSGHVFRGNIGRDIDLTAPENVDPHTDCFQTWGDAGRGGAGVDVLFDGNWCDLPVAGAFPPKCWQLAGGVLVTLTRNVCISYRFVSMEDGGSGTVTGHHNVADATGLADVGVGNLLNATAGDWHNNLWIGFAFGLANPPNARDHNAYWDMGCAGDTGDVCTDPLIDADYVPQAGSPLIDAGADLSLGHLGTAPDIGIVEVQ